MLIKIRHPNTFTVKIFFTLTWWIINDFEDVNRLFPLSFRRLQIDYNLGLTVLITQTDFRQLILPQEKAPYTILAIPSCDPTREYCW